MFQLVILGAVKDLDGNVWRRKTTDMYVMEITTDKSFETIGNSQIDKSYNQVGSNWFAARNSPLQGRIVDVCEALAFSVFASVSCVFLV